MTEAEYWKLKNMRDEIQHKQRLQQLSRQMELQELEHRIWRRHLIEVKRTVGEIDNDK